MFSPPYATIEEVWGTKPAFYPVKNTFKEKATQHAVLNSSRHPQNLQPTETAIRRIITKEYRMHGLAGVRKYIHNSIIRDIRRSASSRRQMGGWDVDEQQLLYILLVLFGLLIAVDL
jgi:hypothetical protein